MRALQDPSRLLVIGFAGAMVLGGLVLALPIAHRAAPVSFIDALFTAASAVCVTGLNVVDTGSRYSGFGQAVILLLIQIGGVGITTLSTGFFLLLRQRVSLSSIDAVSSSFVSNRKLAYGALLRRVLAWTMVIETAGAAILFVEESRRLPLGDALWYSVFHAISAFCNAGFALRADNLVGDRDNPMIVLPIALLIIIGGLGFSVITEIAAWLRRPPGGRLQELSLHSRTALVVTAILLVSGAIAFAVLERQNVLAGAGAGDVVLTSFFASVTARTAGFNTVSYNDLTAATLYVTIALMFVGGCPGSTAGGIKATTLAVLFALGRARLRGDTHPRIGNRSIAADTLNKAMIILVLAGIVVIVAVIVLAACEVAQERAHNSLQWSLGLLFEVVSALCTVGLTTGITPDLNIAGKIVLIVLMFVGRLGPLTLAVAISRRRPRPAIRYAEEPLMVG
ncbi:MAG: potassium transporter [Rhodospirillales bacterium]|nr:potassium transporter [Rhodospirillales bacterium]